MKGNFSLLLAVILAILPQYHGGAIPSPDHERKKVLILGAGSAGITAAKMLYDQGIKDFLVLEAQDYIGGRMKKVPFAGANVEEGANWIHYVDEEDNPLSSLARKYKMKGHMSNYSDFCMR